MSYRNSYVLPFYLGAILLVFILRDVSFFWIIFGQCSEKFDHTDLNGDTASFATEPNLKGDYTFYSNVMNSDTIAAIIQNQHLIHEIHYGQVYCRLYKNIP